MRNLLFSLLALFALTLPGAAYQESDAGILAYRAGDHDAATTAWLERLEQEDDLSDGERATLLYNLGNAAFRSGELREAVGWYTAALRLRPRDADAWHNLELARSEARLDPADRGDLTATLGRLLTMFTLAESEWLVLGTTLLWGLFLLGEALRGGRIWRRLAWLGLLLTLLSTLPWFANLSRQGEDPLLVIHAQGASVHSEPRSGATVVDQLESGARSERLDELSGWVRVPQGWVRGDDVFPLSW